MCIRDRSYFDTDGWVIGNCKWQGAFYGMDTTPRSALVIDKTGNPSVQQDLSYRGSVSLPDGQVMEIKGINRQRMAQDLVLFNRYYGPETRTNEYGREVKVKQGRAAELSNKGNMQMCIRDRIIRSLWQLPQHSLHRCSIWLLMPA